MIKFYGEVKKISTKEQLERFIDKRSPVLARMVARATNRLTESVSYKDIEEALLSGDISEAWLERFRVLYSEFVVKELMPVWYEAFQESVVQMHERYPKFLFDPNTTAIQEWVAERGASLVQNVIDQQREAIKGVVGRSLQLNSNMTIDELAKVIRPMVGLYPQQAVAVYNYYTLVNGALTEKHPRTSAEKITERAQKAAIRYAGVKHRERAMTIARTELASAYNAGEFYSVKQAIDKGYMGRTIKGTITARDERVCEFCKSMDVRVRGYFDMDEQLPMPKGVRSMNFAWTPPFHPRCRCVEIYEEIEPPIAWVNN